MQPLKNAEVDDQKVLNTRCYVLNLDGANMQTSRTVGNFLGSTSFINEPNILDILIKNIRISSASIYVNKKCVKGANMHIANRPLMNIHSFNHIEVTGQIIYFFRH